jgi:hypothetical protein
VSRAGSRVSSAVALGWLLAAGEAGGNMAVPGSGAVPVPTRSAGGGGTIAGVAALGSAGGLGPRTGGGGGAAAGALDAVGELPGRGAGRGGGFGDSLNETPRSADYATAQARALPEHYKEISGGA